MNRSNKSRQQNFFRKRRFLLIGLLIVLVAGGLLFLWRRQSVTTQPESPAAQPKTTVHSQPTPDDSQPQPDAKDTSVSPSPQAELQSPDRSTFVSNHTANLSGSPYSNKEESICVTTPGARCKVVFTSGGVTKALAEKTVGQDGSVTWDWTLQQAGLSEGSWQITIVVSLNGQTKTAKDALPLTVNP